MEVKLVFQYSACATVAAGIIAIVDAAYGYALTGAAVDELEVALAAHLTHYAHVANAAARRAKEHKVAHVDIVLVDGQSLLPLVAAGASERNVHILIDKTGEPRAVESIRSHATATVRATQIVFGIGHKLLTCNVEQGLNLAVYVLLNVVDGLIFGVGLASLR